MDRRVFLKGCGCCAAACVSASLGLEALLAARPARAQALLTELGYMAPRLSPYFTRLAGLAVQCTLCPRGCVVEEGGRGWCRVRENRGGDYYTLAYGNPCAVNVDPVEKKPLFHVLPGSQSFSIATAGCNMECLFCQNWEISQTRPDETMNYALGPEEVVDLAVRQGCATIASTYVEPTIFMEYMQDVGRAAHARGLRKVMHSNGFVEPGPLDDLCVVLDAACIDLKGFTEEYYAEMTGGKLQPVLDTLLRLRRNGVHLELVTLVVPGKNDDPATIREMCAWVAAELGPDTPHHFTRFSPRYKLPSLPPTDVATLESARRTAMETGLNYVYIGNVPGHEAENTWCPQCGALLIQRRGYTTTLKELRDGRCARCGLAVPGIWV